MSGLGSPRHIRMFAKAQAPLAALLLVGWLFRGVSMRVFYPFAVLAVVGVVAAAVWMVFRDRSKTAAIEAEYGPQLRALAQGDPEPGSSSPEPVTVDADHAPVAGSVTS